MKEDVPPTDGHDAEPTWQLEVSITELRRIAVRLLDHLEVTDRDVFSIPQDYYWFVPEPAVYDPYSEPDSLSLGQLSDDLHELRRIDSGQREPLGYGLVWLACLLRAVGERTVS